LKSLLWERHRRGTRCATSIRFVLRSLKNDVK
jgi:hypothetical protein